MALNHHLRSKEWGLRGNLQSTKEKNHGENMLLQKTGEGGFSKTECLIIAHALEKSSRVRRENRQKARGDQ